MGVVCRSESYLALKKGVQAALFRLGRVPLEHWTDHSTGATHRIGGNKGERRTFNRLYRDLMGHFGTVPKTIEVRKPNQNGDIESAHGRVKGRVEQQLLLRGSRDFGSVEGYVGFLQGIMERANRLRRQRLEEELKVMRLLDVRALPEYSEEEVRVTRWGTVRVERNTYSVSSRLRDQWVRVRIFEDRVEISYHGVHQLTTERLVGEGKHAVDYRHVIEGLVRKPGAFRRYRYREGLFPTEVFRWAYEALCETYSERVADEEYLRILHHAARTMESTVERALKELRARGMAPRWSLVLELSAPARPELPELSSLVVNLSEYDELLGREQVGE